MKKFLITLALCVSMTTASVSAANFGVCTHMGLGNSYNNISNIQAARDTKVEWIRDEARWSNMQNGSSGELKIRDKDMDYIKRVDKAGINQLLILAYGNSSYDSVEADSVFPKQDNATYYNGYLDYVRYTVGQVKDYVDAYEVWNEPNVKSFNYNLLADGTDYAKLYLDAKAIIDELDPTATLVCGSITGYEEGDIAFGKAIFEHIKTQGDVNSLIKTFSIHSYTRINDEKYATSLNAWEEVFDSFGYTGDVWMTENGASSDNKDGSTRAAQAAMVTKLGMQWEGYLKESGRNGVNFWYDLRDDGTDESDYEHNLGLVTNDYVMKPSGHAMKTYNRLTGNKTLDNVEKIKTQDAVLWYDAEYGYLATYKNDTSTVYIAYDTNNNKKTTDVALFGDVAYVYDYLGNITETITNPSGTKSIKMSSTPVIVECVSYQATIDDLYYDADNSVMAVSGSYTGPGNVTMELLKDGNVKDSYEVVVNNGEFNKWFSIFESGNYTVRVGYPEITALGKTSGWAEGACEVNAGNTPSFDVSTQVSYNAENRSVKVLGKLTDYVVNQYITVLAVPASMDVADIDMNAVGYIRQIPATDGEFSIEFKLPEYYTTKTAIYLGGTDIGEKSINHADIAENPYVYVASFEIDKGDALSASAIVRNYAETERKASIVIAQYSSGGRLEDIQIADKTIAAKTYAAVECSLRNIVIDGEASTAKAFIWSDMSGLVPLANFDETAVK